MADESVESRDPGSERSGQAPHDSENRQPDRSSERRRFMIASLLSAPAVMTLSARSARAKKDPVNSCQASVNLNPHTSHHCNPNP